MAKINILALAVFGLGISLAACAQSIDATYLIKPGMSVPETADHSRGDVPRDDYGRPFSYEFLGEKLPNFSGKTSDGAAFSSDALTGTWTVIRIWGLWCHDSMRDADYAVALAEALEAEPGIDFLTIHTPYTADHTAKAYGEYGSVPAYFEDTGKHMPTIVDSDASLRAALKIRWTPSYLIIGPDLTVEGFRTEFAGAGESSVEDFVAQLQGLRSNRLAARQ